MIIYHPATDRRADTSLSKAIGQAAKYRDDLYLQSFPQPAAIVFERFERDWASPVIGGCSARSGCQMGRGACGSDTSQGRMRPEPDAVAGKLGWS
jgi:hypothetical protein